MTNIPSIFHLLTVPLPPMLLEMAGVKGDSPFIAFYYSSSKATWNDGRSCATFPFYATWQPYIEHLAIAIDLMDCNLGADDAQATHVLICDRTLEQVYVASFKEAMSFLEKQHPPRQEITQAQWEQIKAQLDKQASLDMEQMQGLGMFELFLPNLNYKEKTIELIRWLDRYIDQPLIERYLESAKAGDSRAALRLEIFERRCQDR